jgi:type I restriction enzyme R subunit
LPFLFESNGSVTFFTNGLDPVPRSRQVFDFPRPETLADWLAQPMQNGGFIQPCLPTPASKPPNGADWVHEV